MPLWKALLLNLYYHASLPVRWWGLRRAVRRQRVPLVVLYYHRVADDGATPWTVSCRRFTRQIAWLRQRFEFISLEEVQRRLRRGTNARPAVAITFDDGYADNCRHAIPLLVRQQIPCTYFVSVRNVIEELPFDHDLARGHRFAPNSLEELRAMAAAGVVIGAHTYTHVNLRNVIDRSVLRHEIVTAREELAACLGEPVRYFAFPFGQHVHLSLEAFRLAEAAGYEAACSAYGGFNWPGQDLFHLQRIPVDQTMIRLKNWVTGDPRKRRISRFEYSSLDIHQETGTLVHASTH